MRETLFTLVTPALVLALVMGTLLAGLFHAFAVTKGSRLLVSWTIGVTVYFIGAILCGFIHITVLSIGPVDILVPSALSIVAMSIARLVKL